MRRIIRFSKSRILGILGVFGILANCQVSFAQWEFDVTVDLGIVYTDNLRLAADGLEESEVVYVVSPTFTLSNEGDRLDADIRYRPEAFFYSDAPESDAVFHTADVSLTATLLRDALFVYVSGARFQTTGSPEAGFQNTNLAISGNRVDSTILQFRPYWKQNLGFADVLAEITYTDSSYSEGELSQIGVIQDNTERRGRFSLNNHSNQEGVAWGLNYDYRRIEYDQALPFEYQTASADLGYWLNGVTRVFVMGGIETPFDSYFDPSMEDDFWETGFQYTPNQRLDIELAAGQRSYGDTYRARVSYQLRRGQTTLTYDDGAATRGDIGLNRRPILDTDNLDGLLDRPGDSDRFVRKRGEWQTTVELAKSDLSFRVFSEKRVRRTTDVGDALEDEQLGGVAFRWAWRLGVNSTVGLNADFGRREIETEDSDLRRIAIDYAFRFSQRLSMVLQAQQTEESGGVSFARDYTENQYRLNLRADL